MGIHNLVVAAALLLYSFGQLAIAQTGEKDVKELISRLKSDDPTARLAAVESIAAIPDGAADAVPTLIDLYLDDADEEVRRRARTVLGQIRLAARATHALPQLAIVTKDAVPDAGPAAPAKSEIPEGRLTELIKQLKSDPAASVQASEELRRMGAEAKAACTALVEVMMKGAEPWHDARLAATEALEAIHPKLQELLLPSILKLHAGDPPPNLGLSQLGPDGRGGMPLLLHLWSLDWQLGFREMGWLLADMHAVAPTDQGVTNIIVDVVKLKGTFGIDCYSTALELVGKRNLPADELADLYLGVLGKQDIEGLFRLPAPVFRTECIKHLRGMVISKQIKPDRVVKPFIACLAEKGLRESALNALGEFGADAKEAVPVIRRLKLEDPDRRIRSAAAAALVAIDS